MTGYRKSEDVETFIRDRELHAPKLTVISKRDLDKFRDRVFETIESWFTGRASELVHNELARVFHSASVTRDGHCGAADLMSLQRNGWPRNGK